VQDEGITTQQWAVLGALSRPEDSEGMSIGDLVRYLMVSRQNLDGLITRMERDGRSEQHRPARPTTPSRHDDSLRATRLVRTGL